MALHVGSGGDHDETLVADINVTPLVDVMLVLLVIFMITAPMLHQGVEVNLPDANSPNLPLQTEDPIVLSINRDGLVYLMDEPVQLVDLVARLTPVLEARGDDFVFLKGDHEVAYGVVVAVLDVLHRGGITRVGMVTEPPERRDR